jgi:hypothetical protein
MVSSLDREPYREIVLTRPGTPGGLLVDTGILTLKENALPIDPKSGLPHAAPSHPAIVEWRAMTVVEL